jgi:hypothetical protein
MAVTLRSNPLSAHLGFDFFEFLRGRIGELSGTAPRDPRHVNVGQFSFGLMPLATVRRT